MEYGLIDYIKRKLYPFTFRHILYLILFTAVTTYIVDYILQFRLLKWIYFGTLSVIVATLYNQGDDTDAALNIFKLATL